ncbi:MAG: putative metal-binding motif-containing protein [Pseudomonadota bacterium]|nr:putative metal-binding motif-containing protein [Pseudomonadota bacterium]
MSLLLLLGLACSSGEDASATPPDDTGTTDDTGATDDTDDTDDTDETDDTGVTDDADGDGSLVGADCDDADAAVYPGATEACDQVDQDCDGLVDEGFASVAYLSDLLNNGAPTTGGSWYGYDADDNHVLLGSDPDEDGVLDSYQRYTWVDGLFAGEEWSYDGVNVGYRVEYDRDADGVITEARVDAEGDGTWDWSYGYRYVDGRYAGYWYDQGADGVYEVEQRQEFDAAGNLEHYWSDDDGDGAPEVETWYTYDGDKLVAYSSDADGDGVFETSGAFDWDGERLLEEVVSGGAWPSRRTYTYVDADDMYDVVDLDSGDDGDVDWRYTYVWDGELLLEQSYDEYADGLSVLSYTYTYDEAGLTTYATSALDGTYTTFTEYEWQESGVLAYRYDVNADGVWDMITLYNARGTMMYESVDAAGDGAIDSVRTLDVDARTRRIGATTDTFADGALEYEQSALDGYTCGVM